MKINLQEFRNRKEYISEQAHERLPLLIFNYTQACQFAGAWDEYTIMARGLITDLEGNIVAYPFKKFFNYGDERNVKVLPTDNPIIYDKFDGSLGIQYYEDGKVCIATRGSFVSDQAKWATEWIQRHFTPADFLAGKTYLYEIIYPENRIVVNYNGLHTLVLLAVIDTETGTEDSYAHESEAQRLKIPFARHMEYKDLAQIMDHAKNLPGSEEGYVFHWPNQNNLRLKIKGDEYVRLHRLLTGTSSKTIWEFLASDKPVKDLIENVPDEFHTWVKETVTKLISEYKKIIDQARKDMVSMDLSTADDATRREKADFIKQQKYPQIMFALLDDKDPTPMVWRMVKPKYERPFVKDIDL